MRIGFGEEFDAARLVEFLELGEHLGCMELELLYADAGKGEGHLELFAKLLEHLFEGLECRHVGTLYDVADGAVVLVVVVIVMVGTDVEEPVALEMHNLVDLKV